VDARAVSSQKGKAKAENISPRIGVRIRKNSKEGEAYRPSSTMRLVLKSHTDLRKTSKKGLEATLTGRCREGARDKKGIAGIPWGQSSALNTKGEKRVSTIRGP